MRKPRSDSKLKNLPLAKREKIAAWCAEGGLGVARAKCKSELGIATSERALSEFLRWQKREDELHTGNELAMQALDWWKANRPEADSEELRTAQFFALMMKAQAADDPELAIAVLKEQGKDLDRGIAYRRVKLLEENAAKAKAALEGIKSKGGLTPETLKQIEEAARLL